MISVISISLKGTAIISIMPSLVSYTKSIARLCPLSLSQQNPPISLHALTPVKPHLLSPGQASWFLLCLCQPAFHIYADLFINVHYQQVRPQFKATRGLPIAFRVNTHKALQGRPSKWSPPSPPAPPQTPLFLVLRAPSQALFNYIKCAIFLPASGSP